jgi:glucuronosyltransferase
MTFTQRFWNGLYATIDKVFYEFLHLPWQWYLYNKYFPNAKRSFSEMFKNSSITFINNHVSNSFPRPHQPTDVEIGGIHVQPAKALPEDLQEFLDSATEGVIFFSMGSFIDGIDWPLDKREVFVSVFGKLKQKVIWRYSNETLPNNPGNIRIASWFPQRDILAHKNVKLFITHGGLLGTSEALIEGIPVLGFPVFGDQMMNMAKAVARGYGMQLTFDEINEDNLSNALKELLTNEKYQETAKKVSKRFNDRPMTPQESVVYWTEYAVRHHGAAHLQAEAVNMNFIVFHSIDVYLTLFAVLLVTLYVFVKIMKMITRKVFKRSERKKKKTN